MKKRKHIQKEIPPGRQTRYDYGWGEYPNQNAYVSKHVHNVHHDNGRFAYNGTSSCQRMDYARVPSTKRTTKTWRNFYRLFPKFYQIMRECVSRERKCSISGDFAAVEIPGTTHRITPGGFCNESAHNKSVKLRIMEIPECI